MFFRNTNRPQGRMISHRWPRVQYPSSMVPTLVSFSIEIVKLVKFIFVPTYPKDCSVLLRVSPPRCLPFSFSAKKKKSHGRFGDPAHVRGSVVRDPRRCFRSLRPRPSRVRPQGEHRVPLEAALHSGGGHAGDGVYQPYPRERAADVRYVNLDT